MALPTRITLPPSGRPVGGLLSAARPLAGEWWRGVTFSSGQCIAPQNVGTCTDGDVTKVPQTLSDAATFDAFAVVTAIECSTLGRSDLMRFTTETLDVTREFGAARELLTGAASGNPSLADATDLGVAADAVAALACLDQHIANDLSGRLGFIHVPPAVATVLMSEAAIYREGRIWYTASGNYVVVSPGYDGRSPGGAAPSDGDTLYLYATGEVYAATGQRDTMDATERGQNTQQAIAEDAAIVVFDPCFLLAVDSGVTFCDLASS